MYLRADQKKKKKTKRAGREVVREKITFKKAR